MPIAILGIKSGAGFGCTCQAARFDPPAHLVLGMLGRMPKVTARLVERRPDGTIRFEAWSDPERKHVVEYSPDKPGILCKHALACADILCGGILARLAEATAPLEPWEAAANERGTVHWLDPQSPACLCGEPVTGHTWVATEEEATCRRCQKIKEGRMKDHE